MAHEPFSSDTSKKKLPPPTTSTQERQLTLDATKTLPNDEHYHHS
jgi:hypothetical protein